MEDYRPNSHRFKEEQKSTPEKKVEKVVSGTVTTKKKNRLADIFISEDIHSVKNYIVMDVLIPAVKDAIEDIITNGIRMILRGDTAAPRSKNGAHYISYNKYSSDRRDDDRRYDTNRTRSGYSYDDVKLESRGEAERVLTHMDDLIETYGHVTVADLYDLVGVSGSYTDNKYGWTNIRNAEAVRVRDGKYVLKLPKAIPID